MSFFLIALSVWYHKHRWFNLLGVTIDSNFTFEEHINNLCKKSSIHLRALRIVYQDKKSSFEELLQKDNSVSVSLFSLSVSVSISLSPPPITTNEVFNFQKNES